MESPTRTAVYPGSFYPPTIAHLAIAEAAMEQRAIQKVTFAISRRSLGKEKLPSAEDRAAALSMAISARPELEVLVTDAQLIAEIARGYDLVIVGADKWQQMQDLRFYENDSELRSSLLRSLPEIAVAPRAGFVAPEEYRLEINQQLVEVSSTAVRAGNRAWLLPGANWPLH